MKIEKELERHEKILKMINNAYSVDDLPKISLSTISSYIATNTRFNDLRFNSKDFNIIAKNLIDNNYKEIKDLYFNIVIDKYPELDVEAINKKYNEIFDGIRLKYLLEEYNLKIFKSQIIKDNIDKENHETVMKNIRNSFDIKELPSVGIGDLNKNILKLANNNSIKKRFKTSELTDLTNAYLYSNGVGIVDYLIKIIEKQDLSSEDKRKLFDELLFNFSNDKVSNYIVEEIKAKEDRKLFIYKNDHEETIENIKNARRISQLPINISLSTLTSYLLGNSTIYRNDNRLKSENFKNLTYLLLSGNSFDDNEVIEEINNIVNNVYPDKKDAEKLLIEKFKSLPRTNYIIDEVNYTLERQKEFIQNCTSNVNVYFIPNEKSPIEGGKFFNVYINRVDNLNLDDLLPEDLSKIASPKMGIDSVEWYVQEHFDPTFKLVGGIILNKDETIGNVNVFRPNDGKVGVSREEKEKINKIDNLDKEIDDKQEKLTKINSDITEKEKTSSYIEEQMENIIAEYENKAMELQRKMLESITSLKQLHQKKLILKKENNE